MKFKQKIVYITILICALVASLILASCKHAHNFSQDWASDEDEHWQQCEGCAETRNNAKHTVDENSWVTVTQPTQTQTGVKQGECSVCKATVTKIIPVVEHTHTWDGEYSYNANSHFKVCSSCNTVYDSGAHVVTDWTIDVDPTYDDAGSKHGVCNICSNTLHQTIPALVHTHTLYDSWFSDEENHWKECAECDYIYEDTVAPHTLQWSVYTPATTTSSGLEIYQCTVCKNVLDTRTIPQLSDGDSRTVDFYAINDFHGSVNKMSTVGGYLKERKNNANTVLINSGDMFQGSIESNSNYGKLLTDCMDAVGFDAFAFGNHEFDWGLNKLESLAENSNVPFLGANIYHWDAATKTWGTFADELAKEYTTVILDNGLKVGIIGVIGKDQITSISSNLVQTIGFKDPLPIIKTLATKLRSVEACDVVVVSAHVAPKGLVGEGNGNDAPSTAAGLENYVDAVFCAHSHQTQDFIVDGLPFIQGGSYGNYVSHVKLSVDTNGNVSYSTHENIPYSSSWPNVIAVDTLVNNSNEKINNERNQVVIKDLDYPLNSNPQMARLVCRSIAEYAKNQGYDISLAMVNTARKSLNMGKVTYSDLYESIPFDNVVYIAKVKGSEIISEVGYGNYYWRSSGEAIESDGWYTIAVIDYLLFHQNANRDYNYFPSAFTSGFAPVALTNEHYEVYNYRFITRDYLLANTISSNHYTYDNNNTDTSLLQSTVTLTYETAGSWTTWTGGGNTTPDPDKPVHKGTLDDPYDVADALLLADGYTSNSGAPSGYVVGKVSVVGASLRQGSSEDLGGMYLVDDKGNKILIYFLKKFDGATVGNNWNWSGVASGSLPNELTDGDMVVIYAKSLFTYNGTTPEAGSGSYCVSINGEPTN